MTSADSIRAEVTATLGTLPPRKAGRHCFLVTAGPTAEDIDPVRFLSNRSTGRMGMAIAAAAHAAGHPTLLILGSTPLAAPAGVPCTRVRSALEMQAATQAAFDWCDVLVMSAAVADYRPVECASEKLHKGAESWTLQLTRTPDILHSLAALRADQVVIGFSLDNRIDLEAAETKRVDKEMDIIVANTQHAFGGVDTDAVILQRGQSPARAAGSKEGLASQLVERAETLAAQVRQGRTESMRFAARRRPIDEEEDR